MKNLKFLHVGITVSDMKKTIQFYTKYFGFRLNMEGRFDKEFLRKRRMLYGLEDGAYSDFCILESPDGIALELFQFQPQLPSKGENGIWNRAGYTHICLKVDNIFEVYEKLKEDGIPFFFEPDFRGNPDEHWVFLKDPDGNLIELQD